MTRPDRKARKREQQRWEILAAARDVFLREGGAHFTMRKLARELGCAPGTLYLYFKDKNDLIAVLVEESFENLMDELERARKGSDPLESLRAMMEAYVEFGLANPNHYYFAFMLQRTKSLEDARPSPHRSFGLLRSVIEECVGQNLIRQIDPQLATQSVWAGLHGVTSLMITIPNFPWGDKRTAIHHVVNILIDGLHPISETITKARGENDEKR